MLWTHSPHCFRGCRSAEQTSHTNPFKLVISYDFVSEAPSGDMIIQDLRLGCYSSLGLKDLPANQTGPCTGQLHIQGLEKGYSVKYHRHRLPNAAPKVLSYAFASLSTTVKLLLHCGCNLKRKEMRGHRDCTSQQERPEVLFGFVDATKPLHPHAPVLRWSSWCASGVQLVSQSC